MGFNPTTTILLIAFLLVVLPARVEAFGAGSKLLPLPCYTSNRETTRKLGEYPWLCSWVLRSRINSVGVHDIDEDIHNY